MKKTLFLASLVFLALPLMTHAATTDPMVFDSTDAYIGACSYTDASQWTLTQDLDVSTIQLWYYWQSGETELPVTVTKDGAAFASFTATRGSCDPYQASWCNADYEIGKTFPAGAYATKIANAYQCLKPGGTGTVRLYGATAAATVPDANANTVAATANLVTINATSRNTNSEQVAATAAQATDTDTDTDADCDTNKTLTYALFGVIGVLVLVIIVMFAKWPKKAA